MYKGEVQVAEDQLKSFLHTAEGLQIKGSIFPENGSNLCLNLTIFIFYLTFRISIS
jgi:hypothetical protein